MELIQYYLQATYATALDVGAFQAGMDALAREPINRPFVRKFVKQSPTSPDVLYPITRRIVSPDAPFAYELRVVLGPLHQYALLVFEWEGAGETVVVHDYFATYWRLPHAGYKISDLRAADKITLGYVKTPSAQQQSTELEVTAKPRAAPPIIRDDEDVKGKAANPKKRKNINEDDEDDEDNEDNSATPGTLGNTPASEESAFPSFNGASTNTGSNASDKLRAPKPKRPRLTPFFTTPSPGSATQAAIPLDGTGDVQKNAVMNRATALLQTIGSIRADVSRLTTLFEIAFPRDLTPYVQEMVYVLPVNSPALAEVTTTEVRLLDVAPDSVAEFVTEQVLSATSNEERAALHAIKVQFAPSEKNLMSTASSAIAGAANAWKARALPVVTNFFEALNGKDRNFLVPDPPARIAQFVISPVTKNTAYTVPKYVAYVFLQDGTIKLKRAMELEADYIGLAPKGRGLLAAKDQAINVEKNTVIFVPQNVTCLPDNGIPVFYAYTPDANDRATRLDAFGLPNASRAQMYEFATLSLNSVREKLPADSTDRNSVEKVYNLKALQEAGVDVATAARLAMNDAIAKWQAPTKSKSSGRAGTKQPDEMTVDPALLAVYDELE